MTQVIYCRYIYIYYRIIFKYILYNKLQKHVSTLFINTINFSNDTYIYTNRQSFSTAEYYKRDASRPLVVTTETNSRNYHKTISIVKKKRTKRRTLRAEVRAERYRGTRASVTRVATRGNKPRKKAVGGALCEDRLVRVANLAWVLDQSTTQKSSMISCGRGDRTWLVSSV